MNSVSYNIRLNINTLKTIFKYFDINEDNTIICLNTKSEKVRENINEYKDKIISITDESIYLKKLTFGKLYYFLSKNFVPHLYFYKTKSLDKIEDSGVIIEIKSAKIHKVSFNDKYNLKEVKELLKKYRSIDIEYIILFLLLIGGIVIHLFRKM